MVRHERPGKHAAVRRRERHDFRRKRLRVGQHNLQRDIDREHPVILGHSRHLLVPFSRHEHGEIVA